MTLQRSCKRLVPFITACTLEMQRINLLGKLMCTFPAEFKQLHLPM